ncbi:MAG TPA: nuclear transport factor 2 family protein [Chitinophagaceae bacterium]|nr:nuclear transport factor 2 family protein [Chitinophagaceae bacterium]
MKAIILTATLVIFSLSLAARQGSDSLLLVQLNQQIDQEVVEKNIAALQERYAHDFVFTHGTGHVEGKESWLKAVARGSFVSRQHDSVLVEMHAGVGIVRGKLTVSRKNDNGQDGYFIKYVRVYALRADRWQMISHYTFFEHRGK